MKILIKILISVALVAGLATLATADNVATSTVTITFLEIAELETTGTPGTLTITAPTAGALPAVQTEATTTMAWTSNVDSGKTRKITGSLASLFSGITLSATVTAGSGKGTSAGEVPFTAAATAYDFVTAIGNCNTPSETITFKATVTSMVAPYTDTAKVVTWTLTDDV